MVKFPKMTISNCRGIEIGRRCLRVGGTTYNVGDIFKGMKFYVSEKEYFEADAKLTSTNVGKRTASFRGVGLMIHRTVNK